MIGEENKSTDGRGNRSTDTCTEREKEQYETNASIECFK